MQRCLLEKRALLFPDGSRQFTRFWYTGRGWTIEHQTLVGDETRKQTLHFNLKKDALEWMKLSAKPPKQRPEPQTP